MSRNVRCRDLINEKPTVSFLKALRILSISLVLFWVSIVSAETLITVGTGQSYTDLGDAITAALNVTTDSDVVIRIYPNNTPYVAPQNGFVINMGSTAIHSLTIEGYSVTDLVCISGNVKVFDVIGSQTSDISISIRNLQLTSAWKCIEYSSEFLNREISDCVINSIEGIYLGFFTSGKVIVRDNVFDLEGAVGLYQPAWLDTILIVNNTFQGQYNDRYFGLGGAGYSAIIGNTFIGEHTLNQGMVSVNIGNDYEDNAPSAKFRIAQNTFVDSALRLCDISGEIEYNNFRFATTHLGHRKNFIYICTVDIDIENDPVKIRNNFFNGVCSEGAVYLKHNTSDESSNSVTATLTNNTFWNNGYVLLIQINQDWDDGDVIIPQFSNNLFYQCNSSLIGVKNTLWQDCNLPAPILASYSVAFPSVQSTVNLTYDSITSVVADPLADYQNNTYTLTWDETSKSPCINAGYRGENNELTDPDGTPPGIGCVYYPHVNQKYFSLLSSTGIEWLSFPVLDDRSETDGIYWNELGYMFRDHMLGAPDDSQLNQIQWSYGEETSDMHFVFPNWLNERHPATQPEGYKVQFNPGTTVDPVVVNGFKADPVNTSAMWTASVEDDNGQVVPFENWIGYFVPFTQKAGDALSRLLPGSLRDKYLDYVHTIKTQSWGTSRISEQPGSPWIINPNTYTLSEGQMVSLLLLPDAPDEMFWSTIPNPVSPIEKPRSTAFSFEEKLDYTSVFIEFDPEDMPDEVGVYVDGVCKGAAVVDSSLIDVCFYNETAKDGAELELMFYYDGKGKKASKGWTSYNPDSMVFENSGIDVNNMGNYAYISFKRGEGESPVPLVTVLQPNYPNPFNPSTNISFILGKDMDTRLEIYNLRGQRVKTLCKTQLTKGKHTLLWNGQNDHGRQVSSGIYFSRLSTPEGSYTQKMMLMK